MKKYIFSGMLLVLLVSACKTQQDPMVRAAMAAEQKVWYEKAVQAINDREFVLEADKITFRYGRFTYVNANTNFISLHGDKATVQMAFNSPYAGPNGIGGITVDGTVSDVKISTDKRGNMTLSMFVQGAAISAIVNIQMFEGINQCAAEIIPNFNGNRIKFSGNLYPEAESNVYKGRSF